MPEQVVLSQIGADVELILSAGADRGVSAEGIFGGTKNKPKPIVELGAGFFIQEDNVLPEFNIPPADNADKFAHDIYRAVNWVMHIAMQRGWDATAVASSLFPAAQLKTVQAMTFGCEPDFCVYTRSENPPPDKTNPRLRTAGGHVHVSYTIDGIRASQHDAYIPIMEHIVKAMDLYLGVPSLLVDQDVRRRSMYGKAGAFRPKDYGHEYRVLSPFWTVNQRAPWVFEQTKRAVESYNAGLKFTPTLDKAIQLAINGGRLLVVEKLAKTFDLEPVV